MLVRMPEPAERRVAEAAKRTAVVWARLTRAEAAQVEARARKHDPPTVASWLRHLIAEDLGGKKPKAD
jgi:hypothetical protein